jgi:hypothetical protein
LEFEPKSVIWPTCIFFLAYSGLFIPNRSFAEEKSQYTRCKKLVINIRYCGFSNGGYEKNDIIKHCILV